MDPAEPSLRQRKEAHVKNISTKFVAVLAGRVLKAMRRVLHQHDSTLPPKVVRDLAAAAVVPMAALVSAVTAVRITARTKTKPRRRLTKVREGMRFKDHDGAARTVMRPIGDRDPQWWLSYRTKIGVLKDQPMSFVATTIIERQTTFQPKRVR